MRLIIAEKPELGRAIAEALGGGTRKDGYIDCGKDIVTWCFGHMLELCDPEDYDAKYKFWSLDHLPIVNRPWKLKPIPKSQAQLKIITALIKRADTVVNAGDPDAEGQLLVDEILEHVHYTGPVKRVLINDLNSELVKKALNNLHNNKEFYGLYQSALARSVADQLYGYNMTRGYTLSARQKGLDNLLSVGRVQTPILGLVVQRDRAHEAHKKSFYYELQGMFPLVTHDVAAKYVVTDSAPIDDKGRVTDRGYLDAIAAQVEKKTAIVTSVETNGKKTAPPLPYNLLKLQIDASKKYGYKPDQVKDITQSLREKHKLITYNRSDCQYLSEEQHADAPSVLQAVANTLSNDFAMLVSKADTSIKSKAFNSANVSAHHAIIPTATAGDISQLSAQEKNIYFLTARAYLAQFYPSKETDVTSVMINCEGHQFSVQSNVVTTPGWTVIFGADAGDEDEDKGEEGSAVDLRKLTAGTQTVCTQTTVSAKETKPPARYTIATLLTDLTRVAKYIKDEQLRKLLIDRDADKKGEHGGIGTPATRDSIIKTLFDRGFLVESKKQILSTELGREFFDVLPASATAPDMTALWHAQQQRIEKNELTVNQFLDEFIQHIGKEIQRLKTDGLTIAQRGHKCPNCEGSLKSRKGKSGAFWGCSNYPQCTTTFPDVKGQPDTSGKKQLPKASQSHQCPSCKKALIRRKSKQGNSYWWGCSGYPECKTTFSDKKGKPDTAPKPSVNVEHSCPNCKGALKSRTGKNGLFWGCSNYPDCKTTFPDQDGKPETTRKKDLA